MGGIGKTELAIQYALKYASFPPFLRGDRGDQTFLSGDSEDQTSYPGGICWLQERGENLASQIITYFKVHFELQIPDELDIIPKIAYCWHHWQVLGDVLVIIDDVTNYDQISPYLPKDPRFKVIVTTRLTKLAQAFQSLPLEVLTENAALDLLKSLVGNERINAEIDTAKALCQWLGYLPLGLELVGQYLAEREDLSLAVMQRRLDQKRLQQTALQAPTLETTAKLGVAAAFELSWQDLSPDAQKLAYFLSLFALAPIPWFSEDEDLEDLRDRELVRSNLLKRNEQNIYQLHQLVREFISNKLEKVDFADQIKSQHCQLMVSKTKEIKQTLILPEIEALTPLMPHVESATKLLEYVADEDTFMLFYGLATYYQEQGLYSLAIPWFEQGLKVTQQRLGAKHLDVATSLNNLAELYRSQGKYEQAEPLFLDAIFLLVQTLGENHPHTNTVFNDFVYFLQQVIAENRVNELSEHPLTQSILQDLKS